VPGSTTTTRTRRTDAADHRRSITTQQTSGLPGGQSGRANSFPVRIMPRMRAHETMRLRGKCWAPEPAVRVRDPDVTTRFVQRRRRIPTLEEAVSAGLRMADEARGCIDVGGESTRRQPTACRRGGRSAGRKDVIARRTTIAARTVRRSRSTPGLAAVAEGRSGRRPTIVNERLRCAHEPQWQPGEPAAAPA